MLHRGVQRPETAAGGLIIPGGFDAGNGRCSGVSEKSGECGRTMSCSVNERVLS